MGVLKGAGLLPTLPFFLNTFVCIRKEEKKDGCIKIEGALVNAAAMHWDTFFVIVYFSVV